MKKMPDIIFKNIIFSLIITILISIINFYNGTEMGIMGNIFINSIGIFLILLGILTSFIDNFIILNDNLLFLFIAFFGIFNYVIYYFLILFFYKRGKNKIIYLITGIFLLININIGLSAFF